MTLRTCTYRKSVPEDLLREATREGQMLARLDDRTDTLNDCPHKRLGFAWHMAGSLVRYLKNTSDMLTAGYAKEQAEMVRELADWYWDGNENEFADEWALVPRDEIADWLAREWREDLAKLPEPMSEWLWVLWEECCPPDEVAEVLWQRVAERTVIEIEFDPEVRDAA